MQEPGRCAAGNARPRHRRRGATMTKATARRIGKWALIALAGVGLLVLLLQVGAGMYLRSSAGRAVVAEKLSNSIGLPVEVSSVELGARTSDVKFRVMDPA